MSRTPHQQRPDLDNFIKALGDCLKEKDDSSIYDIRARKYWSYRGSIVIKC